MGLLRCSSVFRSLASTRNMSKDAKYCVDSVRQYDKENFVATLLLDKSLVGPAIAIRAFNVEVARVRDQTAEQKIALMRFQFWIDALERIYSKESQIPAHPVVAELCKTCRRHQISKRTLTRLIVSRRENFSKKYYSTLDEMEKYAEESVSPIYYALLEAANVKNVHADHAASHIGKAQGLANVLRSASLAARNRVVFLPQDLLLKHNVSQESVLRCEDSQSFRDIVFEIASRANQHIKKARSIDVPSESKKVFLPTIAVDAYLERLQKAQFFLFDSKLNSSNYLLPMMYYWNKFRSKY